MKAIALVALAAATLACATPASAEYRGTAEAQQACTPDVFRLCGQFIPDAGQITACLIRQKPNLSPACKVVFRGSHRGQKYARR
ncbi:hypothetical protein SAMN06265338_103182 [Rhodoblastus acidophilus]|uniref:Cysteine rich repeat-containing protein n=1 Tax=Rhodoblastus acidophilus TaxID=1074 RepID=A0A212RAH4_RHOAC|nr:hypothetical protein [Rhodoblastus acidophilus]MCW2317439.1 hypothetical protein [Rhodoblastus acidophilus]PPQ39340.1 hypothetical protein CKO16_06185 [Rhodoblastus acidophilus]RAI22413.1 hypothetical protein CH337_05380 [Rhodoblastus acidophilus]SNB69210.1 hypothetical protein SAMN06265338_103182 [Rhodoblastus acidophilus]